MPNEYRMRWSDSSTLEVAVETAIKSWRSAWLSSGRSKASMQNMERELRRFSEWLARADRGDLQTASREDCQDS